MTINKETINKETKHKEATPKEKANLNLANQKPYKEIPKQNLAAFLSDFNNITTEFLSGIKHRNVANSTNSAPRLFFSEQGKSQENSLALLKSEVIPFLSASAGPRYWGFVTGGANPAAMFADWLVTTFDQNVSKDGDSIATNIERQTLEWINELFYLPETFKGIMTTGATAANFLAAITARQFAGEKQGLDIAKSGMASLDIEIFSASPHASMVKGLGLAGLGQDNITLVRTLENSEQMDTVHLAELVQASQAAAKFVIASSGTVTATSFDDLTEISQICQPANVWLHLDAAFGLFERVLNKTQGLTKGIELADSITLDFHKWLNVPYDSGAFLTRHQSFLQAACQVDAPYLNSQSRQADFLSLGIENSRRFRALPVWYTLLTYGRAGISNWVENNIFVAKSLANWLANSVEFELAIECQLNVVLFRPIFSPANKMPVSAQEQQQNQAQADLKTKLFLKELNQQGQVLLSPGIWQGKAMIRAALSNWQTQDEDLEIVKESLLSTYARLAQVAEKC